MTPSTVPGIIVGCGQLGSLLARELDQAACPVGIVDREDRAFGGLPLHLRARCFVGDPLELEVLQRAGIEGAPFVVVATPRDELNLAIAIACKRIFRAERVIARIRDPRRAAAAALLGVEVACPALALASQLLETLLARPPEGVSA